MIGIVITGHGHFASGIKSSLELIAGEPAHVAIVDFPQGDTPETLTSKLNASFESFKDLDGILVFADLAGGSPFKCAVEAAVNSSLNIRVIGGSNLPMILETSLTRLMENNLDVLCDKAVETGKAQVMKFELKPRVQEEVSEGI